MLRNSIAIVILAFFFNLPVARAFEPLFLHHPTLSSTQIAFAYGGEIWVVNRDGGDAQRLITGSDRLAGPFFSPDGMMIAYTGNYNGNDDVYVVSASGGEPTRLTYHPGEDVVVGWTPDGKNVLFASQRASFSDPMQFYTVGTNGGFPAELPLPMGAAGSYSPDGTHLAYVPNFQWEPYWKQYHGGQTTPVWIANLADSSVVEIPRNNSNDRNPMWVGDTIYFLSDRNGPMTLFAYDLKTKKITEVVHNNGFDIVSACAGPGGIVYEQFGSLHIYDFATHSSHEIHVNIAADMPQLRPHFQKLSADDIEHAGISPTGKRAVFEAHGEILTVPADKGDIRNLTGSPAVADRDPAWSPDGNSVAWFSDESGEYALHIRDQHGLEPVRKINLGQPPSFYYNPTWSPDSAKIAYCDKRLNLWYVDVTNGVPVKVDTDYYEESLFHIAWSPDGRWLTYSCILPNLLHAVFVYSLKTKKCTQITDGMSDACYPVFDHSGKYLYFAASTDLGLTVGESDMTGIAHPVTYSIYAVVLNKNLASPVAPKSDDENADDDKKTDESLSEDVSTVFETDQGISKQNTASKKTTDSAKKDKKQKESESSTNVVIDFKNIGQRIVSLPIPARNYTDLTAGKDGILYVMEGPRVVNAEGETSFNLYRFNLEKQDTDEILSGIRSFALSANGEKMLYRKGQTFYIVDSDKKPGADDGALSMDDMEVYVDPPAEWRQMYNEVWRIERDFFYDPNFHGLDLQQAERVYAPFLDRVASRDDLNDLFREMIGNLVVGHLWVRGGMEPDVQKVNVGLLGADYEIANGRYRFKRIYNGENWNPDLQAPLTQPGVNVKVGEYLLAVNGRELTSTDEVYSFFQETAGKQIVLKVGPHVNGSHSHTVTIIPIANEFALRNLDWIESNRRKVDEMTGGRVAYVY
jgi:tricorn protease